MRKTEEKNNISTQICQGYSVHETVFSSFPTSKQKRNSRPKWDHITTGRMRKMSNSFGPSLLHRWKGEHGKMVIFQVTPLATQMQTVPVSECSQVFHAYAGCIPVLLSDKRKLATALLWWHILWQIFTNIIFILAFQLKGARDQCISFTYQYPKCIIPGVLPYWLNACWMNEIFRLGMQGTHLLPCLRRKRYRLSLYACRGRHSSGKSSTEVIWQRGRSLGLPGGASGKEPACKCRRLKRWAFNPQIGKIPWRRTWQPATILLSGESPGQSHLEGHSQRVAESLTGLKLKEPQLQRVCVFVCVCVRVDNGTRDFKGRTPRENIFWNSSWGYI